MYNNRPLNNNNIFEITIHNQTNHQIFITRKKRCSSSAYQRPLQTIAATHNLVRCSRFTRHLLSSTPSKWWSFFNASNHLVFGLPTSTPMHPQLYFSISIHVLTSWPFVLFESRVRLVLRGALSFPNLILLRIVLSVHSIQVNLLFS